MILAFTGSLEGMSARQIMTLAQFLTSAFREIGEFHHGDAIGADSQAHFLANNCRIRIVIHPTNVQGKRAYCEIGSPTILPVKAPIERNHDMVDVCDLLIAAPTNLNERVRSGTWSTIRYAREQRNPTVILDP